MNTAEELASDRRSSRRSWNDTANGFGWNQHSGKEPPSSSLSHNDKVMPLAPTQTILLVEASPEDREATLRATTKAGLSNPVHWCDNGDKTLDYLHRRGEFADPAKSPRLGVILLDLNMPGTDVREVMSEVTQDSDLKLIPIAVLTTSSDERDIDAFFASGAKSDIVKLVTQNGILKALQRLDSVWSFNF